MASAIGKDISSTSIKLGKLAQRTLEFLLRMGNTTNQSLVAKRKTLFDDRPVEISVWTAPIYSSSLISYSYHIQELTFIVKQDIASINKQIASLQSYVKQRNAQSSNKSVESKLLEEHTHNVVMLLQNKLASTSMTFKDVLELRTQVCDKLFIVPLCAERAR